MRPFEELQPDLGYHFSDLGLLERAVTHSSFAHEQGLATDNEQLEFLGDAILGFVVSDILYRSQPGLHEGELSKLKGFFVSSANLVKYAEQLQIGQYLQLGRGEEKTGGRSKQALLVDALEAIIGAMYLDGGIDACRTLINRFCDSQVSRIDAAEGQIKDFKTALQELLQARSMSAARYAIVSEDGPDHQKLFTVSIEIGGSAVAGGVGLTRKAAEQAAAKQALLKLNQGQENSTHERSDVQEIDGARVL